MKKLFKINSILVLVFAMTTLSSLAGGENPVVMPAPQEGNQLLIEGKILGDYKADITVFYFDVESCTWIKYEKHTNVKKYNLMLNPETSYQLWYKTSNGLMKVLYVNGGMPGVWEAEINIDFERSEQLFANLFQYQNPEEFLGNYYKVEPLDVVESEQVTEKIENSCLLVQTE